jgi:hypothetical protein
MANHKICSPKKNQRVVAKTLYPNKRLIHLLVETWNASAGSPAEAAVLLPRNAVQPPDPGDT